MVVIDILPADPANPINPAPAVGGDGVGIQPSDQPEAVNEAAGLPPLPPINAKKRKPNASGSRRCSSSWEHFDRLPASEAKDPTAACKHCGKKYLCDPKIHGTSNLNAHIKVCPSIPTAVKSDPNQTVLTFGPGGSGGGGPDLGATSQRFNLQACRRALAFSF